MEFFEPKWGQSIRVTEAEWEEFGHRRLPCPFCGHHLSFPVRALKWVAACVCAATVQYLDDSSKSVVWLPAAKEEEVRANLTRRGQDN